MVARDTPEKITYDQLRCRLKTKMKHEKRLVDRLEFQAKNGDYWAVQAWERALKAYTEEEKQMQELNSFFRKKSKKVK